MRCRRINDQVDINLIVSTGIYTYDHLPFFFLYGHPAREVDGKVEDILTDMFIRDITEGIAGSGVKAGVIKTATDRAGVTPNVERILRAVARAHRETGVPITTHTVVETRNGLEQQRIFAEEGVDLSRVIIGHSGDSTDLDYLRATARRRVDHRRRPLRSLPTRLWVCPRWTCGSARSPRSAPRATATASCFLTTSRATATGSPRPSGNELKEWVQTHVTDEVVPAMLAKGITQEQVSQMMTGNPRRIFEAQGPY